MNSRSTVLIMHQAILDSGVLTQDVMRRMRHRVFHRKVMALSDGIPVPWRCTPNLDARNQMLARMNYAYPSFVRSLSTQLGLMLRSEAVLASPSSTLPTRQLMRCAQIDDLRESTMDAIDRLAALIEQASSDELHLIWARLNRSVPGIPRVFRFRPVVFCVAWYLAWEKQSLPVEDQEQVFNIFALPFASALIDSYVEYAHLARA